MNDNIAIQDKYEEKYQHCWGCGAKNETGLHLKSYPYGDGTECICRVTVPARYTGGVPDNMFGGMIAMIFDCHGTASAAWFAHNDKGLELTADSVIERYITARLEIDYKRPTPMDKEITVTSHLTELTDRKAVIEMEMESDGIIRAQARMVAVRASNARTV